MHQVLKNYINQPQPPSIPTPRAHSFLNASLPKCWRFKKRQKLLKTNPSDSELQFEIFMTENCLLINAEKAKETYSLT